MHSMFVSINKRKVWVTMLMIHVRHKNFSIQMHEISNGILDKYINLKIQLMQSCVQIFCSKAFAQFDHPISHMSRWCDLFYSTLVTTSLYYILFSLLRAAVYDFLIARSNRREKNREKLWNNNSCVVIIDKQNWLKKQLFFFSSLFQYIFNVKFFMKIMLNK